MMKGFVMLLILVRYLKSGLNLFIDGIYKIQSGGNLKDDMMVIRV